MNTLSLNCCWIALIVIAFECFPANAFSHRYLSSKVTSKLNLKSKTKWTSEKNAAKTETIFQQILLKTKVDDVPTKTIEEISIDINVEDDYEQDDLVDAVTAKLDELQGLWYSDDFYGPHGREWVSVVPTLIGETARSALQATKVTGDPHVPAGCITFQTDQWPNVGQKLQAQIQVRANPNDPNGFSWLPGDLTLVAKDRIVLGCLYNPFMRSEGTFYREKKEGEEE